jgi:hypothetical protein
MSKRLDDLLEARKRLDAADQLSQEQSAPQEMSQPEDMGQPQPNYKHPRLEGALESMGLGKGSWLERMGENQVPGLDAFGSKMEQYGAPVAGGILQGAGSSAASIGNLALSPFTDKKIPHPDLKQYLEPGMATDIGFGLGELGGYAMGGGAAAKLIGKGQQAAGLSGLTGKTGMLADALKGFGAGAAISEDLFGGRALGGALGAAGAMGSTLTNSGVGKKVMGSFGKAKNKFNKLYGSIWDMAKKEGIGTNMSVPSISINKIKKGAGGTKYTEALTKFKNNPTLENAQKAQSDLGKLATHLDDMARTKPNKFSTRERDALDAALNAQKKIKGKMFEEMSKSKDGKLAKKYFETSKGYAKEVGPYLDNPIILKAEANNIPASKLGKALKNRELESTHKFMEKRGMGKEFPQVGASRAIDPAIKGAKKAAPYAGAVAAGALGARSIDDLIRGE